MKNYTIKILSILNHYLYLQLLIFLPTIICSRIALANLLLEKLDCYIRVHWTTFIDFLPAGLLDLKLPCAFFCIFVLSNFNSLFDIPAAVSSLVQ